jgi:hypothetical protein
MSTSTLGLEQTESILPNTATGIDAVSFWSLTKFCFKVQFAIALAAVPLAVVFVIVMFAYGASK